MARSPLADALSTCARQYAELMPPSEAEQLALLSPVCPNGSDAWYAWCTLQQATRVRAEAADYHNAAQPSVCAPPQRPPPPRRPSVRPAASPVAPCQRPAAAAEPRSSPPPAAGAATAQEPPHQRELHSPVPASPHAPSPAQATAVSTPSSGTEPWTPLPAAPPLPCPAPPSPRAGLAEPQLPPPSRAARRRRAPLRADTPPSSPAGSDSPPPEGMELLASSLLGTVASFIGAATATAQQIASAVAQSEPATVPGGLDLREHPPPADEGPRSSPAPAPSPPEAPAIASSALALANAARSAWLRFSAARSASHLAERCDAELRRRYIARLWRPACLVRMCTRALVRGAAWARWIQWAARRRALRRVAGAAQARFRCAAAAYRRLAQWALRRRVLRRIAAAAVRQTAEGRRVVAATYAAWARWVVRRRALARLDEGRSRVRSAAYRRWTQWASRRAGVRRGVDAAVAARRCRELGTALAALRRNALLKGREGQAARRQAEAALARAQDELSTLRAERSALQGELAAVSRRSQEQAGELAQLHRAVAEARSDARSARAEAHSVQQLLEAERLRHRQTRAALAECRGDLVAAERDCHRLLQQLGGPAPGRSQGRRLSPPRPPPIGASSTPHTPPLQPGAGDGAGLAERDAARLRSPSGAAASAQPVASGAPAAAGRLAGGPAVPSALLLPAVAVALLHNAQRARELCMRAWRRLRANADVNGARMQLGRALGEGTFGLVRVARVSAVAKYSKPGGEPQLAVEAEMLARVRDAGRRAADFIVRMIAECNSGAPGGFLVLERCQCTLERALSSPSGEAVRRRWAHELLQGLALLEQLGVTHQDLKAENLLIGFDGKLRIADFGIAKETGAPSGGGWTLWWRPPEVLLRCGASRATDAAEDRWAAALLIHQMACGSMPLRPEFLRHDADLPLHTLARGVWWCEDRAEDNPHILALAPPAFARGAAHVLAGIPLLGAHGPLRVSNIGDPLMRHVVRALGRLDPMRRARPAEVLTSLS
eukprot:TRINITY_DN39223_c0_g1_i1.p1 TRINITY_DN39223_c0_g1~~TRINITY_DN39223_c0_g1_i1.p1  ORF type:complete len:1009 (+),score=198.26 TRINITY_DN39223_c0_g1_i1:92-3118(+)